MKFLVRTLKFTWRSFFSHTGVSQVFNALGVSFLNINTNIIKEPCLPKGVCETRIAFWKGLLTTNGPTQSNITKHREDLKSVELSKSNWFQHSNNWASYRRRNAKFSARECHRIAKIWMAEKDNYTLQREITSEMCHTAWWAITNMQSSFTMQSTDAVYKIQHKTCEVHPDYPQLYLN